MYLQLDTQFNPFTFDEMMKPLLYYKEAYDAAEAQYSEMAQNAEMWRDVATKENSPIANAMYQRFATEFNSAANDFNKGMTASNRGALLGLKKRYAQEIVPIARAHEAMKEANELRLKAGPDAEFEVREYNSIDPFLGGGTANNRYLSKEAITKKTAALTEAAVNSVLRDYDISPALGGQVWEIVQHTGGSLKELKEALKLGLSDHPIVGNILSEVRQRMIKEIPFENYDDIGKKNILGAIDTGIYVGLDKPVRSFQANADYISAYQNKALSLQAAQSGLKYNNTTKEWDYNPNADPRLRRSTVSSNGESESSSNRIEVLSEPTEINLGKDDYYSFGYNEDDEELTLSINSDYFGEDNHETRIMEDRDFGIRPLKNDEVEGKPISYEKLPQFVQEIVNSTIRGGNRDNYYYLIKHPDRSRPLTGDNYTLQIIPKNSRLSGDLADSVGDLDLNAI